MAETSDASLSEELDALQAIFGSEISVSSGESKESKGMLQ